MQGVSMGKKWRMGVKLKVSQTVSYCVIWSLLLLVKHGTTAQEVPTFDQTFYVSENVNINTLLGRVGSELNKPQGITYDFFSAQGEEASLRNDFTISATGEIRTKAKLDRERKAKYSIVAYTQDITDLFSVKIQIVVLDENDNSPTFAEPVIYKEISESTPTDAKFALGSAVDRDVYPNNTQRYAIIEGNTNGTFRIRAKRTPNGVLFLDLEINYKPDYELISNYTLKIRAYDGGNPSRYGDLTLNIKILDINDNQPIFNTSRYFGKVSENAIVGTAIVNVFATDSDSGENGKIGYFIDRSRSDQGKVFDVNPTTGLVYVNKALDYESKKSYELVVVARDNGVQKLQTSAVVSIEVIDVNDNEPSIHIVFLTEDNTPRISEKAQPGDFVARISVSDPDLQEIYDAHVNVTLNGGDGHFGLTTQDNVVYLVVLSKPLDRELKPFYQLTVIALDSGTPPKSAVKTFTVLVIDTNDNAPEFTQNGNYNADIQEVVPAGSSVIQVTAVDRDDGNNSKILYSILSTPQTHSDWFQIDNRTGLITTRMRVDCETASAPQLTVVAVDSGVPPQSSTATVNVRIHDVNDNQPVFDHSFYNVSVPEDQSVGSCIVKVCSI